MRRAFAIVSIIVAAALAAGTGETWAQQMATTTTVVDRPDFAQLQASALDWLRATASSTQFVLGATVGIALTEAGRFLWRWSMRTFGVAQNAVRFVMHHRLIAVAIVAGSYYLVAHRTMT